MFNCSGGEWIVEALRLLEKSKPLKQQSPIYRRAMVL